MWKERSYVRLGLWERQEIEVLWSKGVSVREIGRRLNRSPSTISTEMRACKEDLGRLYGEIGPLERARERTQRVKERRRRSRRRERLKSKAIREHVIKRIMEDRWSPEGISERIGDSLPGAEISARAIRYFIKVERPQLMAYLPERGKPKRQRVKHRRGKLRCGAPEKRRIDARPHEAQERTEAGHWEGDTVVSCRGTKGGIVTLRDRKTRYMKCCRVRTMEAQDTRSQLLGAFAAMDEALRKTVTFDNGSEFSSTEMLSLERTFSDFKVYYCHPYSPSERGTNENGNRLLRRFLPKGSDLSAVSREELHRIQTIINNRPMKCLNWRTPQEALNLELERIRPSCTTQVIA